MDISKYLPVGAQNAIECTILAGGNSLTGRAWLEENTSTEASIRLTQGTMPSNGHYVIADTAITAILVPDTPPADVQQGGEP